MIAEFFRQIIEMTLLGKFHSDFWFFFYNFENKAFEVLYLSSSAHDGSRFRFQRMVLRHNGMRECRK